MDYSKERTNKDKDTFQQIQVGKIVRVSEQKRKEKKSMKLAALQIQFGINQKRDNTNKTKQLNLWT